MEIYNVQYEDKYGKEETYFESDGRRLLFTLRNIKFIGSGFDNFEPQSLNKPIEKFDFDKYGCLINFKMIVSIPINLLINDILTKGILNFSSRYYEEDECDWFFNLSISVKDNVYFLPSDSIFDMESALIELQNLLPDDIKLVICLSCKYANYSPGGKGQFGSLACFLKYKSVLNNIKNKSDLLDLWSTEESKELVEFKHETFYCPQYEQLTLDDFTYSDWEYYVLRRKSIK